MSACEKKCALAGHPLMGCMWLADIKFDGEGHVPLLKLEAKGSNGSS